MTQQDLKDIRQMFTEHGKTIDHSMKQMLGERDTRLRHMIRQQGNGLRQELANSVVLLEEHILDRLDTGIEAIRIVADYVKSEPSVPDRLKSCETTQHSLKNIVRDHGIRLKRLETDTRH